MQAAQRRRPGQFGSTSTGTAQSPSSSSQTRTATPGPQAGQSSGNQQSTQRGHKSIIEGPHAIVSVHRVMRLGLKGFVGTTFEPDPDPETGLYSRTLDVRTQTMLIDEIDKNARKLYSADESEKYDIVYMYDSIPGLVKKSHLYVIRWAQEQRPGLYREHVETRFTDFVVLCRGVKSEAGKERDHREITDAYWAVDIKILDEYEKEKKAGKKRVQQSMHSSRAGR